MSTAPVLARVHDAATAVLAVAIVADPFGRRRMQSGFAEYVTHQQRVDAVMRRLAPSLSVASATTGVAAAAALHRARPAAAAWRAGSVLAVAGAVALTVRVHVPINERLRSWSPQQEAPGWREARARWEGAHLVRRGLVAVALGCIAAARARPAAPMV